MSVLEQKLAHLSSMSRYDLCIPGGCLQVLSSSACITWNKRAGACGRMLKVLLHGSCSSDCAYCPVRIDRRGFSFSPAELSRAFLDLFPVEPGGRPLPLFRHPP